MYIEIKRIYVENTSIIKTIIIIIMIIITTTTDGSSEAKGR